MDVIMCITCGEKWPHGAHPDNGGQMAYQHQVANPTHKVLVGDISDLTDMLNKEKV